MTDPRLFQMLLVLRCLHCGQDTPHVDTDKRRRCLACGHIVEKEPPSATED